jgi:hypothetical protein
VIINLERENACAATTASWGELVLPDLWIAPKKSVAKFMRKEMVAPGARSDANHQRKVLRVWFLGHLFDEKQ